MKTLMILLIMTTTAMAQEPMPKTVPWTDAKGESIGTATFWLNRMFLRDTKGELVAQVIVNRDGTRILLDPHGKELDRQLPLPKDPGENK